MTKFDATLQSLQNEIDALSTRTPEDASQNWAQLKVKVDQLCSQLARADDATRAATLPALGDIIRSLDLVIADLSAAGLETPQ